MTKKRKSKPPSTTGLPDHPAVLQQRIRQLESTRGQGLEALLTRFPDARRLLERLAELAWLAEPQKAHPVQVVRRSRGHGTGDGIALLGDHIATPGYAVASRRDQGRLGAAVAKVKACADDLERIASPENTRPKDLRPRCGSTQCPQPNLRQPAGIRFCGYCGREMRPEAATAQASGDR